MQHAALASRYPPFVKQTKAHIEALGVVTRSIPVTIMKHSHCWTVLWSGSYGPMVLLYTLTLFYIYSLVGPPLL